MLGNPIDDACRRKPYAELMADGTPYIELRICLEQPPELLQLVSAFAAVGHQFDAYIRREHPALEGAARLFVKEIRQGSTIVELIPQLAPLIANMDAVLIVDGFVTRYGGAIRSFIQGVGQPKVPRTDLKDYLNTVAVVASDTNGRAIISSSTFHETKTTKRVEFEFSTPEAKQAQNQIERQAIELDTPIYETKENVLMIFWQSNLDEKDPGKRTGQKVIIEAVSDKPLAMVYATEMTKEKMSYWISHGDKNIYKLGFYVDCYVERLQGRPVAYRIASLRDVIDLPD